MPRRRSNEREQARAAQFANALANILHELHISHRDLADALHTSRYTVDSWTRAADPALPGEQNRAQVCQLIEQRQGGAGVALAAAAQFAWTPADKGGALIAPAGNADALRHNLPAALTSFVGRDTELREVAHLLTVTRLLTLTGVGGVGKTRLALQLAQQVSSHFAGGVWLVELAALSDPALVWHAIGSAVGVQERAADPGHHLLTAYLHSKHLLLILDNCEHLVGACASASEVLLRACPHLHILTTSREVLGVSGEVLYRVLPLTPPPAAEDDAHWTVDIAPSDAVRLFVERARAVQPSFALSEHNALAVAHICRRLDGLPLALELAAVRVRHFAPEQVAELLDDRFRLLTGGSRTALPRQQTLRAALDWSHDLLAPTERALFRRLSVFAGGWRLDAAERVTADGGHRLSVIHGRDVSDILSLLVDKSLVVMDQRDGEARYHILETVRAYAREQCAAAGEVEAVRDEHLAYFHRLVLNVKPVLCGAEQLRGFAQLDREVENIRAALEWALATQPVMLVEMADALQIYWQFWGSTSEGLGWVKEASTRVATLLSADGVLAQATISRVLAEVAGMQGENALAASTSALAVALYRTLDDLPGLGSALCVRAFNTFEANQFTAARAVAEEAIALLRTCDDQLHLSYAFGTLARTLAALGEYGAAYEALQESMRSARAAGAPLALSMTLLGSAAVDVQRGELDRARKELHEAILLFQATHNQHMIHVGRGLLADIARQRGEFRDAEALYHQVIAGWRERGQLGALARCIECLAFIADAEGKHTHAVCLLGATAHVRGSTQAPMTEPEEAESAQHIRQLRTAIGIAAFEAAWAAGAALTVEQTVTLALNG